jgi:hypothetical protein
MPGFMLTKDQARTLATQHAFTITNPNWDDYTPEAQERMLANSETEHGRTILHCFGGSFGADWDLPSVLGLIDGARACAFMPDDLFEHCLYVQEPEKDGRYPTWRFNVPASAGDGLTRELVEVED